MIRERVQQLGDPAYHDFTKKELKRMFTLTFSANNAAFILSEADISLMLSRVKSQINNFSTYGDIRDEHGNTIGQWSLTDE